MGLLLDTLAELSRIRPGTTALVVERFHTEAQRTAFRDCIAESDLSANVDVVPSMSLPALTALLRNARIGLSPVSASGQGALAEHTKLFEYLATGVIPVASDLPGARRVLGVPVLASLSRVQTRRLGPSGSPLFWTILSAPMNCLNEEPPCIGNASRGRTAQHRSSSGSTQM